MTTRTIPEYLEDERQQREEAELRIAAEAARIQPLQHGHHRTAKQPTLELPSPASAPAKAKTAAIPRTKPGAATARKKSTAAIPRQKSRAARKTATKSRKAA
jgi:hypothetical protein